MTKRPKQKKETLKQTKKNIHKFKLKKIKALKVNGGGNMKNNLKI